MRFVIQRVTESSVKVDGEVIGKIGKGFMVLIGVANSDTKDTADKMLKKMLGSGRRRVASDFSVYSVCEL